MDPGHSNPISSPLEREKQALLREEDTQLRSEGLLSLASRLERKAKESEAAAIYRQLKDEAPAGFREKAAARLQALEGGGNFGSRFEIFARNFFSHAADPAALAAMTFAGGVFKIARVAALQKLLGASAGLLTRGMGAQTASSLFGFGAEGLAFTFANRLGSSHPASLSWQSELGHSYLSLGALKMGSWGASQVFHSLSIPTASAGFRVALPQAGMLAGILLSQRLESWAGFGPEPSLALAFLTLLHFNVAGALSKSLLGPRFSIWERELEIRSQFLDRPSFNIPPFSSPILATTDARVAASSLSRVESREAEIWKISSEIPRRHRDAFRQTGWAPSEQAEIWRRLKAELPFCGSDLLQRLPQALRAMAKTGWSSAEKTELLLTIAQSADQKAGQAFRSLGKAIQSLEKTDFSSEEKYGLLVALAQEAGSRSSGAFAELSHAVAAVDPAPWSASEKLEFLTRIFKAAGEEAGEAFQGLEEGMLDRPARIPGRKTSLKHLGTLSRGLDFQGHLLVYGELARKSQGRLQELYRLIPIHLEMFQYDGWELSDAVRLLSDLVQGRGGSAALLRRDLVSFFYCTQELGWKHDQQRALMMAMREIPEESLDPARNSLTSLLPRLSKRFPNPKDQADLICRLLRLDPENASLVFDLFELFFDSSALQSYPALALIERISLLPDPPSERLGLLSDFLQLLVQKSAPRYQRRLAENLDFLSSLMEAPLTRQAVAPLIQGLRRTLLPPDLSSVRGQLVRFLETAGIFSLPLFLLYRKKGETVLAEIRSVREKMLSDELSLQEARQIVRKGSISFLVDLSKVNSPASDFSMVGLAEEPQLLQAALKAGDLRRHIPSAWRNHLESFRIPTGTWRIPEGSKDSQGKIGELVQDLVQLSRIDPPRERALLEALQATAANPADSVRLAQARSLLLRWVGRERKISEKLPSKDETGFYELRLLENLLTERDQLPKSIDSLLRRVRRRPPSAGSDFQAILDPRALGRQLVQIWEGSQNLNAEDRDGRIRKVLQRFSPREIEAKLLGQSSMPEDLVAAVGRVMEAPWVMTLAEWRSVLLASPLAAIRAEKSRYIYVEEGVLNLGLRAVKGPTYGVSGITSGVCTVDDLILWKDPRFTLFALSDLDQRQVRGYAHSFELTESRTLTLPGINPMPELLAEVDVDILQRELAGKLSRFAELGNYRRLYLPKDENILSNDPELRQSFRRVRYPERTIPTVHWNNLPEPYPFNQVYVLWEKKPER